MAWQGALLGPVSQGANQKHSEILMIPRGERDKQVFPFLVSHTPLAHGSLPVEPPIISHKSSAPNSVDKIERFLYSISQGPFPWA